MRVAVILLSAAFVICVNAYKESNELNVSPEEILAESNLMNGTYDVVVYIGDSHKGLPENLTSVEDAITSYLMINPNAVKSMSVIPYPSHPCRKLIYASTGDLSSDVASSKKLREAGEAAMHRVTKLGFKRALLIVGPLLTAQSSFVWAHGEFPKMSATLGALHALYKPLQVREMVGPDPKVITLGLYQFSSDLLRFVKVVGEGEGVMRDIGDSDPQRMTPIKIVEYLEALKPVWAEGGVEFTVEDVIQNKHKYPMAYAVNRATIPNPSHHGKVVTAWYTPKSNAVNTRTLILVGKGVTLDTGGADLKIEGKMYGMHNDKLGAAAVAGLLHIAARLKPPRIKIVAYMPYIRNSVGKHAYLPDEIVTLFNGLRVRVTNTDAEGRNIMSDVLFHAKNVAKESEDPHIFTIATLTGAAKASFGSYTVTMDNGPAEDAKTAQGLMKTGDCIGDPTEVVRIRYEDFKTNMPVSEFAQVQQYNPFGDVGQRGQSYPMGYLSMVSELDKHGRSSSHPIKYTHCDIAGSAGGIDELATGAPLRMFSLHYFWPPPPEDEVYYDG